jgi:hypothetical protein
MVGHLELLSEALAAEAEGQLLLLEGVPAPAPFARAAAAYRASWEAAPPEAFGRLAGLIKAAVLGDDATEAAGYVLGQIPAGAVSPVATYASAIALLVQGDDDAAARAGVEMAAGGAAFERTAAALVALARRDRTAYAAALAVIVADFEGRDAHLTGVAIADTAVMLERLAAPRDLQVRPVSPVMPPV